MRNYLGLAALMQEKNYPLHRKIISMHRGSELHLFKRLCGGG
ncbi:hypothetical protein [Pseudochrobactrum sp. Wa41.01b-1]|nr:hypothetical protein [Pseudochrobactrum sp. Wa41.01b-1]